jgi:two-component system sensor histidine kinase UhpB
MTRPGLRLAQAGWRSDLWRVAAAVLLCYGLSSALDLHETLARWLAPYERWDADELPLTAGVLTAGLAWYAVRRRREVQTSLRLREQAEARAAELLAHNRELARQLIGVQESERRALARELHDELGQRCSALLVETAGLRRCARDDAPALLPAASRAHLAGQGIYQLVGDLLRRLRPANLDTLGLVAALQELCEAWEERSGVACVFHHQGPLDGLPDAVNVTLYRVTQEALTNVARHAQASGVHIMLARPDAGTLSLAIHDDGRGMDPQAATRGLGLLGASERAAAIGGELQVRSLPGQGVRLRLAVPLPAGGMAAGDTREAA